MDETVINVDPNLNYGSIAHHLMTQVMCATIDDLGITKEEHNVLLSLLRASYLEVDNDQGIIVWCPRSIIFNQSVLIAECESLMILRNRPNWHRRLFSSEILQLQFPLGMARDINEEVNGWYWDNTDGVHPPVNVLHSRVIGWTRFNAAEWFNPDPKCPGLIDALWELIVTLISSLSVGSVMMHAGITKYYLVPASYSQFTDRRALAAKAWINVRAEMLRNVLGTKTELDIESTIPDLSR